MADYKNLRELRGQLSRIEGTLLKQAVDEKKSLDEVVSDFMGIVEEDCGGYVDRPQLGVYAL